LPDDDAKRLVIEAAPEVTALLLRREEISMRISRKGVVAA